MRGFNLVVIVGNLTRDPELRYTSKQTACATINVAINEKFGETEKTTFVKVVVWGRMGENCSKYLSKGAPVLVEGKLNFNEWEDEAGVKHKQAEVVANNVNFLPTGKGSAEEEEEVPF